MLSGLLLPDIDQLIDTAKNKIRLDALLFDTGLIVDAAIAQSERERESFWAIRDATSRQPMRNS